MSPAVTLLLHWWRGIGPDIEPDLFLIRWRLGFITIGIERSSLLERFRELQALVDEYTRRSGNGRPDQRARDADGQ